MLESFLENKAIINAIVSVNNEFKELDLNENEWKETKLFCDFLKPFFEFTVAMSGSEYPTFGTLLLFLDYLLDHLNTTISDNLNNSAAYLTLILDPRYKTQIIPNDLDLEIAKNVLTTEFTSYQILVEQDKEINEEINKETNTSVGEKRKPLGIMEYIIQKKKKSSNLQSRNEIDEYLAIPVESQNVNPCEWWKHHQTQYPILAKIAQDYICIPATSVSNEQAFSKSGELISKKRNRLGDRAIEACMCLNSWITLFDNK